MAVLIDNVPILNMAFQASSNVNISGGSISNASVLLSFSNLAANGNTQSTASVLTANVNLISTVNLNSGVVITTNPGNIQYVIHRGGANTLNIFPPVNAQIETQSANTPFQVANGYSVGFLVSSLTQIYALIGGPSAS